MQTDDAVKEGSVRNFSTRFGEKSGWCLEITTVTGQQWDTGGELSQRRVTRKPPNTGQQLLIAWMSTRAEWAEDMRLYYHGLRLPLLVSLPKVEVVSSPCCYTWPDKQQEPPLAIGLVLCKFQECYEARLEPAGVNDSELGLYSKMTVHWYYSLTALEIEYSFSQLDQKDSGASEVAQW